MLNIHNYKKKRKEIKEKKKIEKGWNDDTRLGVGRTKTKSH